MRFIDRFTRDDVSAKVWWPSTMLLLVVLVLAFPGEHRAIDARHRATADADAALTARVIAPALTTVPTGTIGGQLGATLAEEVRDEILVNDARIRAIRIWSPSDHAVIWSSTAGESLGGAQALNDEDIDAAVAAGGAGVPVATHRSPDNAPSPTLFYAYSAFGAKPLVAQFDYFDSRLTSDVRASWLGYQIVLAVGFLLALTLSLLSMREPKAKIGTGVPFYPESVPSSLAVMDADRAVSIEHAGDRIKDRVGSLQQRLGESEAARLRAEGQLQQALAALNTPGHRMPVPVLERRDEAPAVVARGPEPVGEVPAEPAPASRAVPEPERAPAARAAPEPEPVEVVPEAEPAVEVIPEPEPVPVVEPAVVAAATPIVERSRPAKETKPKRRAPSTPVPVPAAVAASEPEAARGETDRPEVVVVPDLRRTEPEPAPEDGSAAAVLDRLVEPVASHPASDEAGDLRARLARTAAVKKPGSKERRELDEQQHRH